MLSTIANMFAHNRPIAAARFVTRKPLTAEKSNSRTWPAAALFFIRSNDGRSWRSCERAHAYTHPPSIGVARRPIRPASTRSGASLTATSSPLKKSLHAAEQDRPDVAAARAKLAAGQPKLKPGRLVFIDETSVNTKMTRLYGRAPVGERLVAKVPRGHWKTLTLVSALRAGGLTAPYVIDGAMDGPAFLAYVKQVLVPALGKPTSSSWIICAPTRLVGDLGGGRQLALHAGLFSRFQSDRAGLFETESGLAQKAPPALSKR